ncbi:uncharacterized protein LOC120375758 [Mauremys reevesii]|uniref:uncharacterized protein LOC120375758 n=1 Tax=Mauremys reevesii TaxID=260615 RepID=UPI00193FF3B3|nr:uncharacterized protein LOC120375758 [Mauremys reevesii]XP_039352604.1 uncharacterized protein LOC120375758 [Mauremys reevesii]
MGNKLSKKKGFCVTCGKVMDQKSKEGAAATTQPHPIARAFRDASTWTGESHSPIENTQETLHNTREARPAAETGQDTGEGDPLPQVMLDRESAAQTTEENLGAQPSLWSVQETEGQMTRQATQALQDMGDVHPDAKMPQETEAKSSSQITWAKEPEAQTMHEQEAQSAGECTEDTAEVQPAAHPAYGTWPEAQVTQEICKAQPTTVQTMQEILEDHAETKPAPQHVQEAETHMIEQNQEARPAAVATSVVGALPALQAYRETEAQPFIGIPHDGDCAARTKTTQEIADPLPAAEVTEEAEPAFQTVQEMITQIVGEIQTAQSKIEAQPAAETEGQLTAPATQGATQHIPETQPALQMVQGIAAHHTGMTDIRLLLNQFTTQTTEEADAYLPTQTVQETQHSSAQAEPALKICQESEAQMTVLVTRGTGVAQPITEIPAENTRETVAKSDAAAIDQETKMQHQGRKVTARCHRLQEATTQRTGECPAVAHDMEEMGEADSVLQTVQETKMQHFTHIEHEIKTQPTAWATDEMEAQPSLQLSLEAHAASQESEAPPAVWTLQETAHQDTGVISAVPRAFQEDTMEAVTLPSEETQPTLRAAQETETFCVAETPELKAKQTSHPDSQPPSALGGNEAGEQDLAIPEDAQPAEREATVVAKPESQQLMEQLAPEQQEALMLAPAATSSEASEAPQPGNENSPPLEAPVHEAVRAEDQGRLRLLQPLQLKVKWPKF